ncbi:Ubiquinone biosynthesis protein COQ9, mitochondrial [Glycine max]|nr:Ubiquinone biosynthesis protein COQ9, mitochondrial [Glycine max]
MYRTAAKRLLCGARYYYNGNVGLRFRPPQIFIPSSRFSTSETQPLPIPHATDRTIPVVVTTETENPNSSDSSASSSPSSSSTADDATKPRAKYEDQHTRVLQASLSYVLKLGWTEAALVAGARDVGLSPSIVGSFPRKEAALVEYFMDGCLQRLADKIDSDESLQNLTPSDCISKLIRFRLEMQAPYISTWPQALSIQAQPVNVPTSFKQRAVLVDEIWHAAGDNASDIDWYAKRTILGGIYSTTEIYMLTDTSPDFRDTWAFLDARVKDAFDLKKTIQENSQSSKFSGTVFGRSCQYRAGKLLSRVCRESFPEMSRGGNLC